jgi:ATP-binding cassette subfamily B protein
LVKERGVFWFIRKNVMLHSKYIMYALVLHVVWTIFINMQSYMTKILINSLIGTQPKDVITFIAPVMAVLLSNIIITRFSRIYLDNIFFIYLPLKLKKNIRLYTIKTIFKHSNSFYSNNLCGSLVSKINDMAEGISDILPVIFERYAGLLIVISISLFTAYSVGFKYSLLIIFWTIIFFIFSYKTSNKSGTLSSLASEERSKVVGTLTDVISNIHSVKLFTNQTTEYNNLNQHIENMTNAEKQRDMFSTKIYIIKTTLFIILTTITFCFLLRDYQLGIITPGDFCLVLSINFQLSDYLSVLSKNFYRFSRTIGNLSQALKTLFVEEEIVDRKNASELVISTGDISYKNVIFSHDSSFNVFKNLTLTIAGGSKVGLVGYSGVGKSTFVNLLLRSFDVNNGYIEIDGQNISTVTQNSLHRAIGVIPQNISLFHRSIFENISYGNPSAPAEQVFEAARKAHIHDFITMLENGYNTIVGEGGIKLSGGQKQRIAIARCILKNAPILVLDEATSHLDSTTEQLIRKSLQVLMQNKTSIIIAHRISTIMNLDRILVMNNGEIIEDGTHKELLKMKAVYYNLWSNQVNGFIHNSNNSEQSFIETQGNI